ncbi:MAG: nucleotidyltransferase family protein [Gammaproteobacteria bacterium]
MPLQAIILAAGSSRRFPGNKLLQQLPGQTCLLDKSYRLASHLTSEVLLVINDDPRLAAYCQAQAYPFIINTQAHTGMASSIVTGISASPEAEGWAIFLADMPGIKSTTGFFHTAATGNCCCCRATAVRVVCYSSILTCIE